MPEPALAPAPAVEQTRTAGWYGKIPSLGDFAMRRLPPSFIIVWDSWLQHSIAASRAALDEAWLDLYLRCPIWRFALMPGVCGESAWAGILMPSVDKVGRNFPLTLALAIESDSASIIDIAAAQSWYASLERVALSALSIDFLAQDLEDRLTEVVFPAAPAPDREVEASARQMAAWCREAGAPHKLALAAPASLIELLQSTAGHALAALGHRKSFWWSAADESESQTLHCFSGLPPDDYFAILLKGESA